MATGPVEYSRPTSLAFEGMKAVLFRPFDAGKWFVLGFSAWLAGLLDGGGSGGGGGAFHRNDGPHSFHSTWGQTSNWVRQNWEWLLGITLVLVIIGFALFLLMLWVSSRGKFMFLDNVLHNRAEVTVPWNQFRDQGNSLFLWRLGFMVAGFAVVLAIGGTAALCVLALRGSEWMWLPVIPFGLVLMGVCLVLAYIGILLEDFVVPLMYRDRTHSLTAWRKFLRIHGAFPVHFIGYALWRLLLKIGIGLCLLAIGLMTCCVGLILFALPYIGAVILLPVSVFFRLLGPEFLKQFGGDYELSAAAEIPPTVGP